MPGKPRAVDKGPGQRQHKQESEQQLEKQQQGAPQLLDGRVRLRFLEKRVPQVQRRDPDFLPFQPQHPERDNAAEQRDRPQKVKGIKQVHR